MIKLGIVFERLLVKRVQNRVSGAIRGGAGALGLPSPKCVVMPPKGRW